MPVEEILKKIRYITDSETDVNNARYILRNSYNAIAPTDVLEKEDALVVIKLFCRG